MDRVLTDLANRVMALERQIATVNAPKADAATVEHLRSLDEQMATMGAALSDLMRERS